MLTLDETIAGGVPERWEIQGSPEGKDKNAGPLEHVGNGAGIPGPKDPATLIQPSQQGNPRVRVG
jgi:hypothetical protein